MSEDLKDFDFSKKYGSVARKEDARFIRGKGTFVDDIKLPGMLHGAILRSPLAHARITSIDTAAASAHPMVEAVITGELLADAPAARIATVYSPVGTCSYGEASPYATWCSTIWADESPYEYR